MIEIAISADWRLAFCELNQRVPFPMKSGRDFIDSFERSVFAKTGFHLCGLRFSLGSWLTYSF